MKQSLRWSQQNHHHPASDGSGGGGGGGGRRRDDGGGSSSISGGESQRDFAGTVGATASPPHLRRIGRRASGLLTDLNDVGRIARLLQTYSTNSTNANDKRSMFARWQGDFFGGMVAALIAVPYGMALSVAIGLRPEAGLYTSIIGGIVSGLLSKSPVLISGLSATAVPILASVAQHHGVNAALTVGFLSGLIMTLIGLLRLGRFANYLPQSIVSAFTTGLGLTIAVSQLKALLDVSPQPVGFDLGIVDDICGVVLALSLSNPQAVVIGGVVIVTMLVIPRWKENVPSSLIGVLLATATAWLFDFQLRRVGALPSGLPDPRMIEVNLATISSFLHPALTLAGLFTINQVLTGIVVDRVGGTKHSQESNRELLAQGTANLVTPFFGAPPGVAMLARTVASTRAGAMTRFSIIWHSFVLLLFIIPLRGFISQIPLTALAAVTVMVGLQLTDWRRFLMLKRECRAEAALFVLTFSLVVLTDLVIGVGIGFVIAMILFIERAAESMHLEAVEKPHTELPSATVSPLAAAAAAEEVQAYRLIGPLFFATSEKVLRQLRTEVTATVLVLDLEAAGLTDSTAPDLFRKVFHMQQSRGGNLFLTGLDHRLYSLFEQNGLIAEMGTNRFALKPATRITHPNFTAPLGSSQLGSSQLGSPQLGSLQED